MISVCMATYNGEKFIKEQIDSILCQLSDDDELIISDDHSMDSTVEIIKSYSDDRIKLFYNDGIKGCTHNFENALMHANGNYIFLSDQDDVWLPNKLSAMTEFLVAGNYDLVMCNCTLVDENLEVVKSPFFDKDCPMERSILSNFYRCACLGCCLVFTKDALKYFLPFPTKVVLHDLWIYLFAIINLRCGYLYKELQFYRRHGATVTFAGKKNTNSLWFKIKYRAYVFPHLIYRSFRYKFNQQK